MSIAASSVTLAAWSSSSVKSGAGLAGIWEMIPSGERFWSVGRVDPGVAPPVGVCAVGRRDHPDPDLPDKTPGWQHPCQAVEQEGHRRVPDRDQKRWPLVAERETTPA